MWSTRRVGHAADSIGRNEKKLDNDKIAILRKILHADKTSLAAIRESEEMVGDMAIWNATHVEYAAAVEEDMERLADLELEPTFVLTPS